VVSDEWVTEDGRQMSGYGKNLTGLGDLLGLIYVLRPFALCLS